MCLGIDYICVSITQSSILLNGMENDVLAFMQRIQWNLENEDTILERGFREDASI